MKGRVLVEAAGQPVVAVNAELPDGGAFRSLLLAAARCLAILSMEERVDHGPVHARIAEVLAEDAARTVEGERRAEVLAAAESARAGLLEAVLALKGKKKLLPPEGAEVLRCADEYVRLSLSASGVLEPGWLPGAVEEAVGGGRETSGGMESRPVALASGEGALLGDPREVQGGLRWLRR